MSAFEKLSNDALMEMLNLHFGIITGSTKPVEKPVNPSKKPDKKIPFEEFSFVNFSIFMGCFRVAVERGILSPAEIAIGNEVMGIIG